MKFRPLRADEVEIRVGSVIKTGARLLFYKDARCDQNILDETVGCMNWQRHHSRDNANCTVSIWDDDKKQWVEKEDTGTESYTEKEKGLASDSFKRACFNWGIGRELYTAPRTFIRCKTTPKSTGKGYELENPYEFSGAKLTRLEVKENRIAAVTIVNSDGEVIFDWEDQAEIKESLATEVERKSFMNLCEEKNVEPTDILKQVGWRGGNMTKAQHGNALRVLMGM